MNVTVERIEIPLSDEVRGLIADAAVMENKSFNDYMAEAALIGLAVIVRPELVAPGLLKQCRRTLEGWKNGICPVSAVTQGDIQT